MRKELSQITPRTSSCLYLGDIRDAVNAWLARCKQRGKASWVYVTQAHTRHKLVSHLHSLDYRLTLSIFNAVQRHAVYTISCTLLTFLLRPPLRQLLNRLSSQNLWQHPLSPEKKFSPRFARCWPLVERRPLGNEIQQRDGLESWLRSTSSRAVLREIRNNMNWISRRWECGDWYGYGFHFTGSEVSSELDSLLHWLVPTRCFLLLDMKAILTICQY